MSLKMGDESIPQYNFSVDVVEQTVDLRNFTIESTNPLGHDEMDEVIEALSQVDITTEVVPCTIETIKATTYSLSFVAQSMAMMLEISIENFINFEDALTK